MTELERIQLLKEASLKFREAKKLEFRLYKTIQEGYVMLMKAAYEGYKSPDELRSFKRLGDGSNAKKFEKIIPKT